MDREHRKRMETVRLLITETIMVVVIIVTAIILTFVAMGYNLDKNGELGQSGLVQLRSFPSGASITIDGETILPRTATSRMLSAGDHTIKLTKDGYDTWEKTITSESGRLLKLEYMRLFYQDRIPETIKDYNGQLGYFVPTPNRDYAIMIVGEKWIYLDMRGDNMVDAELDLSALTKDLTVQGVSWNDNSDKLLVKTLRKNETEWLIVNVKSPKDSINVTKEFAMNFSDVRFMSESGDKLVALENGNLRTVQPSGKTVSQVLADNVKKFSYVGDNIVYVNTKQQMGLISGDSAVVAAEYSADVLVNVTISDYIGEKYLTVMEDNKMTIYKGELPNSERSLSDMEKVLETTIGFTPSILNIYGNNELIVARDGKNVAVYDSETGKLHQYELDSDTVFLIDGYMVGEIVNGNLVVMDFDGTNKRMIARADSPAVITRNNKWLYYLTLEENKINLTREKIVE